MSAAEQPNPPVDEGRPIASIQERLIARLADLLIHVCFGIAVSLVVTGDDDSFVVVAIATAVIAWIWETAWLARSGATIGKHLAGTRVVTRSDPWESPGVAASALRTLPRLLWGLPFALIAAIPVGLISLVLLAATVRRQTIADIIARTVVVSVREDVVGA